MKLHGQSQLKKRSITRKSKNLDLFQKNIFPEKIKKKENKLIPSGPRADRFLGSLRIEKPYLRTLSERRSLSFLTRQRYSHAPPPPFSTWFSNLFTCSSSVLLTIFPSLSMRTVCNRRLNLEYLGGSTNGVGR